MPSRLLLTSDIKDYPTKLIFQCRSSWATFFWDWYQRSLMISLVCCGRSMKQRDTSITTAGNMTLKTCIGREIGMSGVLYQFKVFQILQDVYLVHSEVAKSGRDNIEYYHEFIKMVIRIFLQKKRHFLKVRFIDRMTRKLYRRRRTYFKKQHGFCN